MAVTLNAYFYNDGLIKNAYTFVSDTDRVNDLAGWAGDLQSLVDQVILQDKKSDTKNLSIQEVESIILKYIGNEKYRFGLSDVYSDVDAVNLYDVFCSSNLNIYQILNKYYRNLTQRERFVKFVNHYVNHKIYEDNNYLDAFDEFNDYAYDNVDAYIAYSNVYNGEPIIIYDYVLYSSRIQ